MSFSKIDHQQFILSLNLPTRVKLVEVSPRDGLQNQPLKLAVDTRVALINQLSRCGFSAIEVGSLVSPKKIPQMADSEAVYQSIAFDPTIEYSMLVANQQGFNRAIKTGIKRIAVFCSASDKFSLKNIHCTITECLATIQDLCAQALEQGISVRAYISCVLGCPYQGDIAIANICNIAGQLLQYGCDEIALGDTIGTGTAGKVQHLVDAISQSVPVKHLAVHFHDTYGQALANILTAMQSGITTIDCSVSGLGGCPFATGASGNVASEDVVYLLNGLGIESGVNLDKLIATSWFISHALQRKPTSRSALALRPAKKEGINNCF